MASRTMLAICTILVALTGNLGLNAQEHSIFTRDVDSLIANYLQVKELPSAAVGVVQGANVRYAKRILRDSDLNVSKSYLSIYNIASVAKPFVALAIMQLVQEGKLDIKKYVVDYLPDFSVNSKFYDQITIEHLLTHTSGLPNTSSPNDYEYLKIDTTDNALSKHIKSLTSIKLNFKPGKKYAYSNVGFEVLGQIIATISGYSFDDYMYKHVFKPLQMTNTSYILSDFKREEIAQPYEGHPIRRTKKFPYNRAFSPSGNLFTSIEDLNKWMIFMLNDGQYAGFKPLKEDNFDKLINPRVAIGDGESIGLSWYINGNLIFHDGLDLGYSALLVMFKKQKIGISVLINHLDADCNELLNLIIKSIKF